MWDGRMWSHTFKWGSQSRPYWKMALRKILKVAKEWIPKASGWRNSSHMEALRWAHGWHIWVTARPLWSTWREWGGKKKEMRWRIMGLRWSRSTGSHCQNFSCGRNGALPGDKEQRNDLFLFESLAAVVRTRSWDYHREDQQVIQTRSPATV